MKPWPEGHRHAQASAHQPADEIRVHVDAHTNAESRYSAPGGHVHSLIGRDTIRPDDLLHHQQAPGQPLTPSEQARLATILDRLPDRAINRAAEVTPFQTDTIRRSGPKIGRNDPCPCGSGRKFKRCCGADKRTVH